jgi:hypothetical protein
MPRRELLNGWKEIATYLGKDVRTVQRWEKEAGLPVLRQSFRQRGGVQADPAELDAWKSSTLEPVAPNPYHYNRAEPEVPRTRWWIIGLALRGLTVVPDVTSASSRNRISCRVRIARAVALCLDTGRIFGAVSSSNMRACSQTDPHSRYREV